MLTACPKMPKLAGIDEHNALVSGNMLFPNLFIFSSSA